MNELNSKRIFLVIVWIISITGLLLWACNKEKNPANSGIILEKPTNIGAVQVSKDVVEWWFSFPVDTDGDGIKDILVLDKAQHTSFATEMEIGWKVTFRQSDGISVSRYLPFLWNTVLDPDLPGSQPQPIYLATGYSK